MDAGHPVFSLAQDGERDAVFEIYEAILFGNFDGGPISLTLLSDPSVKATGYVREVSPAINAKSATIRVKVTIQNPPAAMTLGSSVAGTAKWNPVARDRIAMDRVDGCRIEACGLGRRPFDHDGVTEAGHDQPIRSGISDRRGRARARRTRGRRWWQVAQFRSARVLRGRFVMKSQLSIIAALSASLLMTAGCKQDTHVSEPVRPVLSIIVEPTPSGDPVFVGAVEPRFKTDLAFRVLGRLIARHVNIGDTVTEGQTVADIDPLPLELAVRSARAELANAQARFETASAAEQRKRMLILPTQPADRHWTMQSRFAPAPKHRSPMPRPT